MTREEMLNGMSEEEFYEIYPTQEDWENAQQMKLGGLSGAPHNGQPTADEFFNYGSHANDAVNVPMSNPFFAANGGTPYYGGPIRPYQTGGYKPAPNPDTYFNEQDAALNYPAKGSNVNVDYSKVTKKGPALSQYSTSELNKMGANIPVPNPAQDARFAKIAAYNKEHPYIPAGGNLFKKSDGSEGRFNYTNGAYVPYQTPTSQPLASNAYGGYMDMGGNYNSPTNYGSFSVPMTYGGDSEQFGGVLDPSNNQKYPILEEGGKNNLMSIIKAHSKKMRKSYEEGGDTVMQGGNSTDKPTQIRNTFKSVLKRNIQNHMINEEEKAFSNEMMQMGGFSGGPGMNYNNTTFSQPNKQNQALAGMYQQRIDATQDNLKNDFNNLGNATNYLAATANPYQKTTIKAEDGIETKNPRTLSKEEWEWLDEQRKAKENKTNYNRYFGESARGTSGMTYFPMNYNPYSKISKGDVAKLKQIAATPTSGWQLKEFNHRHFGPWGKTKMKFGYRDETPYTENKVDPIQVDLKNNPNNVPSEPSFQEEAMLPQYGPRINKTPTSLQDGGFKSSRLGPQGQTVEIMMNPFNHGNAFEDNDEVYYPENMIPIQTGMPQMSYEDQEVNLADILNDVPNPAIVSYRNTSDDKPKVINRESAVKVKSEAKPVKGVQTPVKKAPAPKTLPVKPKVISNAPMPGVNHTPINTAPKKVSVPPSKKLTQNTGDIRKAPQTGVVVDKRNGQAYYIGNKGETGSFPVLTGANVEANYNPYNVTQLANNPKLRNTPVGYYKLGLPALTDPESKRKILVEDSGARGKEGSWLKSVMKEYLGKVRDIEPISAYGQPAPVAKNLGFHRAYSDNAFNPKDPVFVERMKKLNSQNPNMRCTSYGCVNVADASYDEIAKVFPTSDTLMVLDSKNPLDAEILKQFKIRAKQKKYGGLTRAQYGRDHKSTNPADGTYDNFGNPIGLSSATGNMGLASSNLLSSPQGTAFQPTGNAPGAAPTSFQGAPTKTTPTPESVGLQQKNTEMKGMGTNKELDITTKDRPGFDNEAMVNWGIAGINTLASGLEQAQNAKNEEQLANLQLADNAFMATPANAQSRGDYDPNSGMFRMNQMVPVQFPGGMGYSAYGGSFQDGGMQEEMQPQQEQIMQGVASMLQQGAQPEQVAQQLVQMGIPQEEVMQIIQVVMQQMQGGQEQPMQPAMRYGGYAMGGYQEEDEEENEDSYEDDLDEDEIEELRRQGYNVEYI